MRRDAAITFDGSQLLIMGAPALIGPASAVVSAIDRLARSDGPQLVVTPNVDHLVEAQTNRSFRDAYAGAALALIDGMPVAALSRALGARDAERHTGADLLTTAAEYASREGVGVAIIGGNRQIAKTAAQNLSSDTGATVAAIETPFLSTPGDPGGEEVVTRLRESGARIVFLCLGAPKQELWFETWKDQLPPGMYIGAGAAVDFAAGAAKRAPRFVQRASLEWFWRLLMEPRRLWHRYLVRGPRFIGIAIASLRNRKATPNADD